MQKTQKHSQQRIAEKECSSLRGLDFLGQKAYIKKTGSGGTPPVGGASPPVLVPNYCPYGKDKVPIGAFSFNYQNDEQ